MTADSRSLREHVIDVLRATPDKSLAVHQIAKKLDGPHYSTPEEKRLIDEITTICETLESEERATLSHWCYAFRRRQRAIDELPSREIRELPRWKWKSSP